MSSTNPKSPVRFDHRLIKKVLSTMDKVKVVAIPSEFSRVSRVFCKAGGSWERLQQGSQEEVELLRRVIKVAYDKGYLTRKEKWGG